MVNRFVDIILVQSVVRAERVGIDLRTRFHVLANLALNVMAFGGAKVFQFNFATAFKQAHDNLFTRPARAASMLVALRGVHPTNLAADVGFIRFHFARKFVHAVVLHGKADAMQHEPSGLLGDPQSAGNFAGANAVLGIHNHPERGEPFVQAKGAVLENGANLDRKLLFAIAALPEAAGGEESGIGGLAAGADRLAILPADGGHKIQSRVRVGKVFDCRRQRCGKLVRRLIHTQETTPKRLVSQVYNPLYQLTNWSLSTNVNTFNGSTTTTERLLPNPNNPPVQRGQVWCAAETTYVFGQRIFRDCGITNEEFRIPPSYWTNYWWVASGHSEIFRVDSTDSHYVNCTIRIWSDSSTAYIEGKSTMLKDYIQTNCTLVKP